MAATAATRMNPTQEHGPVIQNARGLVARVERMIKTTIAKEGPEAERLRIAIREGLEAKGKRKTGTALEHAIHCLGLVDINIKGPEGLGKEPENALVYLSFALESLEATLAATLAEIDAAEAEAGLRALRRGGKGGR